MPEGHTLHRAARLHRARFAGALLRVWSPQGRFEGGAAVLDGHALESVDAHGKHLFYHWDHGVTLHVHLGLFGRFRVHPDAGPEPTTGTRLAWSGPPGTLHLSGPTVCELVGEEEQEVIRRRLGPDPLRREEDPVCRIRAALGRRSVPIGSALLDQRVIAGIGNVYRAEILFRCGIHPATPARALDGDGVSRLWAEAVARLGEGERSGRIVTVDPADAGVERRRDIPAERRRYVYKRGGDPCLRCGTTIASTDMAGRSIWWCPVCQPA